jgi:glyoxylase I family protein
MALELRGICPLLQVYDMPASLAFYRDRLGFRLVHSAPPIGQARGDEFGWVLLRHAAAELMLNTAYDPDGERPPAREPARVAAHDDTVLYISTPDVDAVYRELRERGLEMASPVITSYGMKQLSLKDPDGFGLCFQWSADQPADVHTP